MREANTKKNMLWNTIGNGLYYVVQWLMTAWLVERLLPEGGLYRAGLLSTAATVANLFIGLAGFGMRNYQVSDWKEEYNDRTYIVSRYGTVGISVLLALIYTAVVGYDGAQVWCIVWFLWYKMLEPFSDVFHGVLQKRERLDLVGISYTTRAILSLAIFALGLLWTKSLPGTLFTLAVGTTLLVLVFDIRLVSQRENKERTSKELVFSLLLKCLPLAVYSFLNGASSNIPKLFLEREHGTEVMGLYNLLNAPVLILQVGMTYLFAPFVTEFSKKLEKKDEKGFRQLAQRVLLLIVGLVAIGCLACLALGGFALKVLYSDPSVAEHKNLLYGMLLCVGVSSASIFLGMVLTVLREMRGLLVSNGVAIVASLLLSAWLVPRYGMNGTTIATALSLAIQCMIMVVFGQMTLKKRCVEE